MKIKTYRWAKITRADIVLTLITFGCWLFVVAFKMLKKERYEIAGGRLEITKGIFSTTHDSTELIRVKDVRMRQSFAGKLMNYGTIELITSDLSHGVITMRGAAQPLKIKGEILNRIDDLKKTVNRTEWI